VNRVNRVNRRRRFLYCFAVPEERRYARVAREACVLTGMGSGNARRAIEEALGNQPAPDWVWSCGFAGGLNPSVASGTVLFSNAPELEPWLQERLLAAGAVEAVLCNSPTVVATSAEKRRLWEETGADAVDMESGAIGEACRERGVSFGAIRVVLDPANEDLPLDFNRVMTTDLRLHWGKLAWSVLCRPGRVAGLLRLRRQTRASARALGRVLNRLAAE
jgi:adenosylhomocysteine nucleosidase